MAILVYTDATNGVSKAATEAVTYGKMIADKVGGDVQVIAAGAHDELPQLGKFGATKVWTADVNGADNAQVAKAVVAASEAVSAKIIIFSHDVNGKAVAPRVAARLKAGLVPGAIDVPNTDGGFSVKVNAFSGKAYAHLEVHSDVKVISLLPNSFRPEETGSEAGVEALTGDFAGAGVQVKETISEGGALPLPEAELVVSAGRGLKGPENWGIVEQLANELGAATACSRPVADMDWRPHHEHVGQTGVAIRPKLYIAAGISGAIQHLAGVNGSKTIVVINTDKEAPFFKAADYGIVGDAFEVLPKLTEAVKRFKASN